MSDAKNKLTELKSRIEEAKEAVKAEYTQKLKELSEFMQGLEKHEVHAIVSVSHHHPYYASLGLQYVPIGEIVDNPPKRGKGVSKAAKVKSAAAPKTPKVKGKVSPFKLSDEKASEYLKVIGKGEKTAKEIEKALDIKNASNAINYLKSKGLIKVSKQEGLKKFYKVA